VTYKNSGLTEVLKSIDPKHLLLETDSPYLPPVPHRGKRNESAFLVFVAEQLCTIYGLSLEDLASQTTENAVKLFNPNPIINQSYQSVNKSNLN
jgi:TatD DNase family protein